MPNPSFESKSACPYTYTQMDRVHFWVMPTAGTSDFFHSCGTGTPIVDIPSNFAGNEPPFDGEAYAGIIVYSNGGVFVPAKGTWSEYIQSPLTEPLVAGVAYRVSFYVSLGDNMGWAIEELGAYFSVNPGLVDTTTLPQVLPAQIVNTNGPLVQADGWTRISGDFVAAGGEKFITIGSFVATPTLQQRTPARSSVLEYLSYYYIDGVSVELACKPAGTQPCPAGGVLLDFESLAHADPNDTLEGFAVSEEGFEVQAVLASGQLFSFGTLSLEFAGSTALHGHGSDFYRLSGSGAFGLCHLCLAEGHDGQATQLLIAQGSSPASHTLTLDGQPGFERFTLPSDFHDVFRVESNVMGTQWDNLCICPSGGCTCPVVVIPDDTSYCVSGASDGRGWSWRLTSTVARDVTGVQPPGAPEEDIVAAFATDLWLAGITVFQNPLHTHCFTAILSPGESLFVGPFGSTPDCQVTGNPGGCTFNPTITDMAFLPPLPGEPSLFPGLPIPGTHPTSLLGLAVGLAFVSWLAIRRSRSPGTARPSNL